MDQVTELLAEREAKGLRNMFVAGLCLAVLTLVLNIIFLPDSPVRQLRLYSWIVPICVGVLALWLIGRRRMVTATGFIFILLVTALLAFAAYANYLGAGPETFAATAIVLLVDYAGMALVIVATGLTLRPIYPLVCAACVVAMYAGLLIYALGDPRSEVAATYAEYLTGPRLYPSREASNVVFPLLVGLIVALIVRSARRLVREGIRLEIANRHLGRYFSPNVVSRITEAAPEFMRPGGREQDVVVLFADITGFTGLTATMRADEALALLSEYQGRMVTEIFAKGGTLDKFIGDGIMATFGTPEPGREDARRAVEAAIGMETALARLNAERAASGLPEIRHRIGLHAGPAVAGNVGTPERLEYTVIGTTVNVASRVETACKALGESLLATGAVKERAGERIAWRAAGEVTPEGQSRALLLFAPALAGSA